MKFLRILFIFLFSFFINETYATHSLVKPYSIEQFLDTKNYAGGCFTYDEKKILFSCDETGVFNVYSIDIEGKNLTQLTHSLDHSIFVLSSFPHDERFIYTCDTFGDERHHLYLWENEHSVKDLTPDVGSKSSFEGWCSDRKSFLFTSNKRDPRFMDLYEMDIETFTSHLLYKNEADLNYNCISDDKRLIVLHKILSDQMSTLYLYDRDNQILKQLTPAQMDVSNMGLDFSLDSKSLYFMTNENSEFMYVKKLNLETGDSEIIEKHSWDISSYQFSKTYQITTTNEDGKTIVKLFNQQTKSPFKLPSLDSGEVTNVWISKSEQWMLLSTSGCCAPNNLYLLNTETEALLKLTNSLSSTIDPKDLVKADIIRFPSYDEMLIPALYYKPHEASPEHKIPALIWVHGGPGGQSRCEYNYLIQYLVNHGYAILAINNRGSSGYGKSFYKAADHKHGEADLDDCMWAKKYLISTGCIDENKIGIMGGSYGGYMTLAALAFRPQEMALGIDIVGVSNWVRTLKSIPPWWEVYRNTLYTKIGHPETETAYLQSISPVFHAKNIVKPLLVLQGANDPRVLKVESDEIIEAVSKNNVPYRYIVFDDEGHGFLKKHNKIVAAKAILEFLDEHFKNLQSRHHLFQREYLFTDLSGKKAA